MKLLIPEYNLIENPHKHFKRLEIKFLFSRSMLNDRHLFTMLQMVNIPKAELWIDLFQLQSEEQNQKVHLTDERDIEIFEMEVNHNYK